MPDRSVIRVTPEVQLAAMRAKLDYSERLKRFVSIGEAVGLALAELEAWRKDTGSRVPQSVDEFLSGPLVLRSRTRSTRVGGHGTTGTVLDCPGNM